jgi:8-oxo-dGTP diphosphatase
MSEDKKNHTPKYSVRIAAMVIQNGKLLLLKGKNHKELWTPGGKIDEGETDLQCLARELKEEIGVELVRADFFKTYVGKSFYNPEKTTEQRIYITSIKGEIKPDAEIESFIWLSKEDFEKRKFLHITITEEEIIPDIIKAGIW